MRAVVGRERPRSERAEAGADMLAAHN